MRIDFYVKWHTAMTCTAPEYVHKQLIIIHVVCCDAMTFLFIVRCHSTEYWNKNEKRNRVNQMYTQSSNNNNKCHTHTYSHTHANIYVRSVKAIHNRLQSKISCDQLNKTKSSWKLKTYTCYCSIKKKHTQNNTIHVCVCVQIQSGPSSFDIETNRIYCPKMLIHVEVLSFNFHWKCKHMAILFLLHTMCWHWLLLLTHITKDLHTHSTAHQQCTTS